MFDTNRLCPACMADKNGAPVCDICGFDEKKGNGTDMLPLRYVLKDRYMVGASKGSNSEGIVYAAWDNVENKAVMLKEYFPDGAADRNPDKTVSIAGGKEFAFNGGLMEFMELNRQIGLMELPSLAEVYEVFEENGTAYAVVESISGITLSSFLEKNGGMLKWEQARSLFLPLLDTVAGLHEQRKIHGGISPETIIVGRDGKLYLTGICIDAVRRAGGDIPAYVYSGYAAIEQYETQGAQIGPHTDVYGLAATLFRTLIGVTPPVADSRLENDGLTIPSRFAEELPRQVLVSLANGLQVRPEARTGSIECFKNEIVYGETEENIRKAAAFQKAREASLRSEAKQKSEIADVTSQAVEKHSGAKREKKKSGIKYAALSAGITAVAFAVIAVILCFTVFRAQLFGKKETPVTDSSASMPSTPQIGDVDPHADDGLTKFYTVPDFRGKYFSQIEDNDDYEVFTFTIMGKQYSDKYARGAICEQAIKEGTEVERDTDIGIIISLGPKEIRIADVTGLTEAEAKLELLKQGFLYDNIEVVEKYDSSQKPDCILEQSPAYGTSVSTESGVKIYLNSYKGEDED